MVLLSQVAAGPLTRGFGEARKKVGTCDRKRTWIIEIMIPWRNRAANYDTVFWSTERFRR